MVEEKKESCGCSGGFKTLSKMLIGAILIVLGAYLCFRWQIVLRWAIQACLGPFLILTGLVFLAIAKE